MAEKDVTRIKVGQYNVGIVGLRQVMEEIAETHAGRADEDIKKILLEGLGRDNYIPGSAREDYGRAFVREFRKFLGQPFEEPAQEGLDIKVLGAGCPQCRGLEQTVMELVAESRLPASVEHVSDIREITRYGVRGTPALLINGRVMCVGSIPPRDRIKAWLLEANAPPG